MAREETRTLSRETQAAYDAIQCVVKTAARPGAMQRDFVMTERRDVENALVLMEVLVANRGYRGGFEEGVRAALKQQQRLESELEQLHAAYRQLIESQQPAEQTEPDDSDSASSEAAAQAYITLVRYLTKIRCMDDVLTLSEVHELLPAAQRAAITGLLAVIR